jgi:hypothetical protein
MAVPTVAPRRGVWPAAGAAVVVICVFGLYLGIIVGQGDADIVRVTIVGVLLSAAAACCTVATLSHDPRARAIAALAGVGALLSLGFLAIFSVGLPLLVAGGLLTGAAIKMGVPKGSGSPAAVAFVVGLLMPWSLLFL